MNGLVLADDERLGMGMWTAWHCGRRMRRIYLRRIDAACHVHPRVWWTLEARGCECCGVRYHEGGSL
jgi:hypothetical protein